MKLIGLKSIYAELLTNKETYCVFKYQKKQVEFDIFFDIAANPFRLGFLVPNNDFHLWINVEKGFEIDTQLNPDDYRKLVRLLNLRFDANNKFSTFAFFVEFNNRIPKSIPKVSSDYIRNLIVNTHNIEEKDKLFYLGIIDWDKIDSSRGRTSENLEKTRLLYPALYLQIKDRNISVKYTDKLTKQI